MTGDKTQRRASPVRRIVLFLAVVAAVPLLLLAGCQSHLIYFPRPYGPATVAEWKSQSSGRTIDYRTSQGNQRAFLQGNLKSPRNLWIVCGGNGTVALDWADWLRNHAPAEDAWLLVDFPGYGDCQGSPSPARIRENLRTALPLAARELGWNGRPDPARLRFFGHSLGAAACLMGASEFGIQRGVLLSPFTSTMAMSRHMTGLPLGFFVWHRFDNAARLGELAARGAGAVVILHGTDDEAIPSSMSRELAAGQKQIVRLREIPGGRHNDLPELHAADISAALEEIGK